MELVDGPTLRHLIDEHSGLPVADVIRSASRSPTRSTPRTAPGSCTVT